MGLKDTIGSQRPGFLIERPGKAKSLDRMAGRAAASGAAIDERGCRKDPVKASIVLPHLRHRTLGPASIRVFLGEPALADVRRATARAPT